jgi:UDP-N-acetylmuramoyl-tripeptide--D-alanyl-D-alanine ligase
MLGDFVFINDKTHLWKYMKAEWGEITAGALIPAMRAEWISGPKDSVLNGLCTDSRSIAQDQLFLALKGEKYNGHDFITQAVDQGAAGVVMEKGYHPEIPGGKKPVLMTVPDTLKALGDLGHWWRQQHPIPLAAITGSVGKTTTKEMTACILEQSAPTLKNEGNLNNLIGLPLTLLLLKETHQRALVEMGMNHPGEIARLTEIADPNIGLITNVGRAHLEGLGSVEAVARAKAELLEKISKKGRVILNGDDLLLMKEASRFKRNVITFGLKSEHPIHARKIRRLGENGIAFKLQCFEQSMDVELNVPGVQNVLNALAASAMAFCLDESLSGIAEGLNRFKGMKGRFTVSHISRDITLVDDTYNANPSSLRAAMDMVRELAANTRRVIVGLGEMLELGDETVTAHLEAGHMVAELGTSYFLAMGEHARHMIEGAVSKGFPSDKAVEINRHEDMVRKIENVIRPGDIILLKGSRKMQLEKVAESLTQNHPSNGQRERKSSRMSG